MRANSTGKKGFIVYLHHTAKEYLDTNQPVPVISLSQVEEVLVSCTSDDNDSDGSIIDQQKRSQKQQKLFSKQLLTRAKVIMRTSKAVLYQMQLGHYTGHRGKSFSYTNKILNTAEALFYCQNDSVEKVLGNYAGELAKMPATFEWIHPENLSQAALQRREFQKIADERYCDLSQYSIDISHEVSTSFVNFTEKWRD